MLRLALILLVAVPVIARELPAVAADWAFEVRFSPEVRREPFTGRIYLFFSRRREEPRTGPDWFNPELFVARDVREWKPDEPLRFSSRQPERLLAFPQAADRLDPTGYRVQAVARFIPLDRNIGTGAGNGYSGVAIVQADAGASAGGLTIDRVVPERTFVETRWTKLLKVRSRRLSEFHGRDVFLEASLTLPASYYDQPQRRYPTIFEIPGFGGTHFDRVARQPVREENPGGVEFLRVLLDPSCPLGHHAFADSANNGPVGQALVEELIPAFDRQFRSVAEPPARYLTGHSSGGWSSLWLQMTYPDHFGGTWSTAPDPVDFRDFQRINLYRPGENMYVDREGRRRPIARRGDRPVLWYDDFARMEWVLGHGGQLHSFEAVFSPRSDDGRPKLLFDRATGAIDTDLGRAWQKYDIRHVLEREWATLGPKLEDKLHVFMGDADTFYLEGATVLLKEALERLGSDAVVEIHPDKDHGTLLTPALQSRIRREMAEAFLRSRDGRR